MKREEVYIIIFVLTILLIRFCVFLIPEVDIRIWGLAVHHFWFGIILFFIGFLLVSKYKKIRLCFISVGSGLIADELVFIILGGGLDKEYWSLPSLLGTFLIILIVYYFKEDLPWLK